jgi:hypothetical protein
MFDSPRTISLEQKQIGILDFDKDLLDHMQIGKKPNSLPPLANGGGHQDKPNNSTQQQPQQKNKKRSLTKSLSQPQPITQRVSTTGLCSSLNSSPQSHDNSEYIDALIKESGKHRMNDFDALCAQLVQQTQDERKQRKSTTRPVTPMQYRASNAVSRKNTFRINEDEDEILVKGVEKKNTKEEEKRPSSNSTNRVGRPKTGYGRRRMHRGTADDNEF